MVESSDGRVTFGGDWTYFPAHPVNKRRIKTKAQSPTSTEEGLSLVGRLDLPANEQHQQLNDCPRRLPSDGRGGNNFVRKVVCCDDTPSRLCWLRQAGFEILQARS